MSALSSIAAPAPDWYAAAREVVPEHLDIEVAGGRIHLRCWGERDRPGLVLVHGGGAHSAWWDHIAPFFAATHRVVAPDLSGHGDSDVRSDYSLRAFADEVMAAAAASGAADPVTVVGHSMGGWVTAAAAAGYGTDIDAIVIIDSPMRQRAPGDSRLRRRKQPLGGYRTRDEITARFTLVPAQAAVLPYVAHHIASESVRRTDTGWVWKFDPAVFDNPLIAQMTSAASSQPRESLDALLDTASCRVGYVRCEHGVVAAPMADQISEMLRGRGIFVELAEAGHHPMLDQPLPLVATIRTLLGTWAD